MKQMLVHGLRIVAAMLVALATCSNSNAAVLLSDRFEYPDGPLVANSSGKWLTHSGRTNDVDLAAGRINLTQAETEDVNSLLTGSPYDGTGAVKALYVAFKLRITTPTTTTNGAHFAHFKDSSTGFRARIWSVTNGAAAGSARIGISSAGNFATDIVQKDLLPGSDYTVVARYDLVGATAKLWVDPASESDVAAQSTDTQTAINTIAFAFRQNSGMGVASVDDLVVATTFAEALAGPVSGGGGTGPLPPSITSQPQSQAVDAGKDVTFSVTATSSDAPGYQWLFNGSPISGQTGPELVLKAVGKSQEGAYSVRVTNGAGSTESSVANLVVRVAEGPAPETIASLRALVDSVNYLPTDTTGLHTAEGIVTSHVNLTGTPGVLFYMQDSTAGIAVFWTGGAAQYVPAAGDRVRVTAPLGHFNGLLELMPRVDNVATSVKLISTNQPLPAPKNLEFGFQSDPVRMESLEGSSVVVSNVLVDVTQPNFVSGSNVLMTNSSGETFTLRIDARVLDVIGQPKPKTAVNITGVLAQFDTSNPRTDAYQLTVTRFSDIQGGTVAPNIRFTNTLSLTRLGDAPTNTFVEHVLLPGDRITITAEVSDPLGRPVTVVPDQTSLPATAVWTTTRISDSRSVVTLNYSPTTVDIGKLHRFQVQASNPQASNTAVWTVYVPTILEQAVTVGEFLANPTTNSAAAHYNPLKRSATPAAISSDDEYVELVNLSNLTLDFAGWTIGDSVQVRHKFYETFTVGSSNAVVIYGGPLNGSAPGLDTPVIPASENAFGFGLNNTGGDSIIVRNAESNLVCRVVFPSVPSDGSMTRHPDMNGAFVAQTSVSQLAVSPGRQYDGKAFSEPAVGPARAVSIQVALNADRSVTLKWTAEAGRTYVVEQAATVNGPYSPAAGSATGGTFTEQAAGAARYYRVRAQ